MSLQGNVAIANIPSLRSRQLSLLETECNRVIENAPPILGPKRRTDHHGFRKNMLLSDSPPFHDTPERLLIPGTAFGTPLVSSDPVPQHGPLGLERSSSPDLFGQVVPSPCKEVLHPIPQATNAVPNLEALLNVVAAPESTFFEESTQGSREETAGHALPHFKWTSPDSSYVMVPPFRLSPRGATTQPIASRKLSTTVGGVSLYNCIDQELNQLDGTTYWQRETWERLCKLTFVSDISECISTIVECLADQGTTRGFPSNVHIADFCAYVIECVSSGHTGSGDYKVLRLDAHDFRASFLSTFKNSWVLQQLPNPGSLSSKYLLRLASFYGHLYSIGVLYEEDYRVCINFLSTLSPLPREGLRALLSANIDGHQELAV